MKASTIFISAFLLAVTGLLLLHLHIKPFHFNASKAGADSGLGPILFSEKDNVVKQLKEMVRVQNQTISLLESVVTSKTRMPQLLKLSESEQDKNELIKSLTQQLLKLEDDLRMKSTPVIPPVTPIISLPSLFNSATPMALPASLSHSTGATEILFKGDVNSGHMLLIPSKQGMEKECELKYGIELIDIWSKNGESWCDSEPGKLQSRLTCYPYHQAHKKLDGRGPDLFCEATNFFIDFSKVHGSPPENKKPPKGSEYLNFDKGSLFSSTCQKTKSYNSHMFMPHHSRQMSSFLDSSESQNANIIPPEGSYLTDDTPTYLLARDEDCENSFHSTADFMNMFLVMSALKISPHNQQVMLFDNFKDGPYKDLLDKAYSPNHPMKRHQQYEQKKVLFKKLIFHLESPAGLIFPKVSRPDPLRCQNTGLFQGYRKFVLQAFNLLDVAPPAIPTVTLTLRHRYPGKNVGRVLKNEKEVVGVLKEGNMMNLNVVDTAKMSFYEQLKLVRSTNILIGVHGAGLMFIMFAAEEAILIEIHPSYRQDRHFRFAARMTGKIYMPLRSLQRETCIGTSDDVVVPVGEFRILMDGAVRLARSFDDGLSECGLTCPHSILALDHRLDSHYKSQGMQKGMAVNTAFPCQ